MRRARGTLTQAASVNAEEPVSVKNGRTGVRGLAIQYRYDCGRARRALPASGPAEVSGARRPALLLGRAGPRGDRFEGPGGPDLRHPVRGFTLFRRPAARPGGHERPLASRARSPRPGPDRARPHGSAGRLAAPGAVRHPQRRLRPDPHGADAGVPAPDHGRLAAGRAQQPARVRHLPGQGAAPPDPAGRPRGGVGPGERQPPHGPPGAAQPRRAAALPGRPGGWPGGRGRAAPALLPAPAGEVERQLRHRGPARPRGRLGAAHGADQPDGPAPAGRRPRAGGAPGGGAGPAGEGPPGRGRPAGARRREAPPDAGGRAQHAPAGAGVAARRARLGPARYRGDRPAHRLRRRRDPGAGGPGGRGPARRPADADGAGLDAAGAEPAGPALPVAGLHGAGEPVRASPPSPLGRWGPVPYAQPRPLLFMSPCAHAPRERPIPARPVTASIPAATRPGSRGCIREPNQARPRSAEGYGGARRGTRGREPSGGARSRGSTRILASTTQAPPAPTTTGLRSTSTTSGRSSASAPSRSRMPRRAATSAFGLPR